MNSDKDYFEQITETDVINILPFVYGMVFVTIVIGFLSRLFRFDFSRDKPKSFRKQQREYLRNEKKIMKELNQEFKVDR